MTQNKIDALLYTGILLLLLIIYVDTWLILAQRKEIQYLHWLHPPRNYRVEAWADTMRNGYFSGDSEEPGK